MRPDPVSQVSATYWFASVPVRAVILERRRPRPSSCSLKRALLRDAPQSRASLTLPLRVAVLFAARFDTGIATRLCDAEGSRARAPRKATVHVTEVTRRPEHRAKEPPIPARISACSSAARIAYGGRLPLLTLPWMPGSSVPLARRIERTIMKTRRTDQALVPCRSPRREPPVDRRQGIFPRHAFSSPPRPANGLSQGARIGSSPHAATSPRGEAFLGHCRDPGTRTSDQGSDEEQEHPNPHRARLASDSQAEECGWEVLDFLGRRVPRPRCAP